MKQILIILSLIFLQLICFSQISINISRHELEDKGFVISNKIFEYPPDQLLADYNYAYMGTLKVEDGYFVCLLFSNNDTLFHRSKIIQIPDEDTYRCNVPGASYQDGFIVLDCQWMRGITYGEKYKVINGELTFVESFMYDLNEDIYKQAEIAEKNDDPVAYCEAYTRAQFYSMDMDYRGAESLRWAYKKALDFYNNKDYFSAADLMLNLEQKCYISTCENLAKLIPDECLKIWGDVTLFYLKANKYEECINLSKRLLSIYEDATDIYLQYGDALYETKNIEYQTVYTKYIDLMKKSGKEEKIPSRVLDRLKI
jgi:hypothetical protein